MNHLLLNQRQQFASPAIRQRRNWCSYTMRFTDLERGDLFHASCENSNGLQEQWQSLHT